MKKTTTRLLALFIIISLLCLAFTLPAFAAPISTGEEVAGVLEDLENKVPAFSHFANRILSIDSLEEANTFMNNYSIGILLITALISLIMAFYGYRALHFAIMLSGFSIGWVLGSTLYSWAAGAGLLSALEPIPVFVPYLVYTICGFLMSFIAMRIIRAGIFFAATAATYFFLNSLPIINSMTDKLITENFEAKYILVRLIISLIVGFLALAITRPVLIVTTGASGGMIAAVALMVAVEQTSNINLELVIGIILAFMGIIVQFSTSRKRHARR